MASSSNLSTRQSSTELQDLPTEILLKIFRDYLPLHDKLETLWTMHEFHFLLEDRMAWSITSTKFSIPFLEWMRQLQPGWYLNTDDWSHRFFLKRDECSMTISLHHFLVDYDSSFIKPYRQSKTFRKLLTKMKHYFIGFLEDYVFLPNIKFSTYHLKKYGFIMIQDYEDGSGHYRMRFCNFKTSIFQLNEVQIMQDWAERKHFKVHRTPERQLVVECILEDCICEQHIYTLSPIVWNWTEACDELIGDGLDPIPIVAHEAFQIEDDDYIKGKMTHHMRDFYLFYMQVEIQGKANYRINKAIERKLKGPKIYEKKSPAF